MTKAKKGLHYGLISAGGIFMVLIIISFIINDAEFYTKPNRLFYSVVFISSTLGEYIRLHVKK